MICNRCNKEHDGSFGSGKFCSRSCGTKFSNSKRILSDDTKRKISESTKSTVEKFKDQIVGDYTKIYLCTCKFSGVKWYSNKRKLIYPDLVDTKNHYANSAKFRFAISSFPKWFNTAANLINEYGWYSTPGSNKSGIKNLNGISRDHMYSINDGWINKIDPTLLKHPANCRLMQHKTNSSKNKNSSITLDELIQNIKKFECLYPDWQCVAIDTNNL
jgi:hypothetical protein